MEQRYTKRKWSYVDEEIMNDELARISRSIINVWYVFKLFEIHMTVNILCE
jgi:hypothetical protein